MKPLIIGFGHKRYTGKDTCVKLLTTHLRMSKPGLCIRKGSLADELKFVCHRMFSWAGLKQAEWYEDYPHEKDQILPAIGMTPREIWIKTGTKAIREQVYQDTWLKAFFHNLPPCDFVFVQDIRFPNEADAILENGGFVFKVNCLNPFVPKDTKVDEEYQKIVDIADSPLSSYDRWTEHINNDGTLRELNDKIIALSKKYLNI